MKKSKLIFLVIFLVLAMLLFGGCEKYNESDEINGLIKKNDLSINMKTNGYNGFTIEKIYGSDDDYCLKIDVTDTYSLRGEAAIKPGDKYKLSFTLKNIDADHDDRMELLKLGRQYYRRFEKEIGHVRCYDIRGVALGRCFDTIDPDEYARFEAAGGPETLCLRVAGKAARIAAEFILDV